MSAIWPHTETTFAFGTLLFSLLPASDCISEIACLIKKICVNCEKQNRCLYVRIIPVFRLQSQHEMLNASPTLGGSPKPQHRMNEKFYRSPVPLRSPKKDHRLSVPDLLDFHQPSLAQESGRALRERLGRNEVGELGVRTPFFILYFPFLADKWGSHHASGPQETIPHQAWNPPREWYLLVDHRRVSSGSPSRWTDQISHGCHLVILRTAERCLPLTGRELTKDWSDCCSRCLARWNVQIGNNSFVPMAFCNVLSK